MGSTPDTEQQDEGAAIDASQAGWILWRGRRVSLFDARTQLDAIHRAYFDEVGSGAENFLYQSGLRSAADWSVARAQDAPLESFERGLERLRELGFGNFRLDSSDLTAGKASVSSDDSLEADSVVARHGRRDRPHCHFTRGAIAGLWCFALGSDRPLPDDLVCWEVECTAAGGQECRFEIGSAQELRERGFVDPSGSEAVRWELLELSRRLQTSSRRLTTLESELAERERAYHNLLENINDVLIVLDRNKRVVFCNRRFLESTGLTLSEAIGSSPLDRIVEADRKRVEKIYDSMLDGRIPAATYQFRVKRPQGTLHIESSARPVRGRDGEMWIEALGRDVTERERVLRELEAANAALTRKQQIADNDLRMAKLVHESMIPGPVQRPELDVDVKYVPVERVGGDYCHILFPSERHCVLTLCDVSGHGMASALLAARVSSLVRTLSATQTDPQRITVDLNRFLRKHFADTGLFVTFFALTIELRTFDVRYCGAGHPGPILLRGSGAIETLASQNLPVGVVDEFLRSPACGEVRLEEGDRILLYTDGVTETIGRDEQPLRASGLAALFQEASSRPLFDVGDWLLSKVADFRDGAPHDDMTLLLVEAKKPQGE